MKKLMVTILVMSAACVFAQEATQLNDITFADHMFTINKDGKMIIQLYQGLTDLGQDSLFGYSIISGDTSSDFVLLGDKSGVDATHITGNMKFETSELKAGDKVVFYVVPTKDAEAITNFDVIKTHGGSAHGNTAYGVEWGNNDNFSFLQVGFTPAPEPTPAGQPLPGALTTMLIAGGCAAYLKRKKSARK